MISFFPEKLRSLLPACLLSLFLHFLVLGGLAGMVATWIAPDTEIKVINAHLVSKAPKEAPVPAETPAEMPRKAKPPSPPPASPPEPSSIITPDEIKVQEELPANESDEEEAIEEEGVAETVLEGDDEGGVWPDIPGQWEAIQEEMEHGDDMENGFGEHVLPDGRIFPAKGEINYRAYRGEKLLEIGTARLEWELRQRTYRFATRMKTTGLIGFLYQAGVETESRGIISPGNGGLFPLRYQVRRGDRAHETTSFDWIKRTLHVESGKRDRELSLRWNSQDLLSLQGQFSFWIAREEIAREAKEVAAAEMEMDLESEANADPAADANANAKWQGWTKTIWMATGKGYESYRIVAIGEESLELPDRVWDTLHFRVSEGRAETDFWLAKDLYWLPVQIRHRDRRDDVYEQRLDRYNFVSEATEELP